MVTLLVWATGSSHFSSDSCLVCKQVRPGRSPKTPRGSRRLVNDGGERVRGSRFASRSKGGGWRSSGFTWTRPAARKTPAQYWAAPGAGDAQCFPGHPFSYRGRVTLTVDVFAIIVISTIRVLPWRHSSFPDTSIPVSSGSSAILLSPPEPSTTVFCQPWARWPSSTTGRRNPRWGPVQPTHVERPQPWVPVPDAAAKPYFPHP